MKLDDPCGYCYAGISTGVGLYSLIQKQQSTSIRTKFVTLHCCRVVGLWAYYIIAMCNCKQTTEPEV